MNRLIKSLLARPALQLAMAGALLMFFCLPVSGLVHGGMSLATRALLSWSGFVVIYLVLVWRLLGHSSPADIRKRAPRYDAAARTILALSVFASIAALGGVIVELLAPQKAGNLGSLALALAIATVFLSWVFVHVMFALHYAHDFYAQPAKVAPAALSFPGTEEPRYGDFLYFSFVIGCACATADVEIRSSTMRRLAAAHGVIAFVFNAAIVGLSVNIAAGLLGR